MLTHTIYDKLSKKNAERSIYSKGLVPGGVPPKRISYTKMLPTWLHLNKVNDLQLPNSRRG